MHKPATPNSPAFVTFPLCRCMDGPSDPDPNCVRCHGTGEPVPSYSVVMLANFGVSHPLIVSPLHPEPFQFTNQGAHERVRIRIKHFPDLARPNCVVNVYPKRPPHPVEDIGLGRTQPPIGPGVESPKIKGAWVME